MCDESVWQHQRDALVPFAEIVIPVFRGFDSLVDMAGYVVAQAPERFSVVGHSMGGRVAWEVMALAADRIEKFCVMDTGVQPASASNSSDRQELIHKAKTEGLQAVADAWIKPMIHPDRYEDERLIDEIRQMILRNSVEDFLSQMKALAERKDQTPGLARISQEVLLVAGEADSHSPPMQHQSMAKLLQRSQVEIVAGAGHMVTMEKPAEVSRILTQWITADED